MLNYKVWIEIEKHDDEPGAEEYETLDCLDSASAAEFVNLDDAIAYAKRMQRAVEPGCPVCGPDGCPDVIENLTRHDELVNLEREQ